MAKKSSHKINHPLVIAAIAFVVLFIILFGAFYYKQQTKIVLQNLTEAQVVTVNKDGTKKYTDPDGYFSFNYPPEWALVFSEPNMDELDGPATLGKQNIKLIGKEGYFEIIWVDTYGGGCDPENVVQVNVGGKNEELCNGKDLPSEGQESWSNGGYMLESESKLGIMIVPIANAPYQSNRNTILSILSTFNIKSVEPIFCGGIAGKSCPNGYSCKLDGDYPDAGGTCIKN